MCGIYGFQNASDTERLSTYETSILTYILAKEMESRGHDSFGGFAFPQAIIYRGLGRVSEAGVGVLRAASESSMFLGHTRAATVGAITYKNCHPFRVDDVVGVHNGSILNYNELNTKYSRPCEVDSEHVFYHLNEDKPLDEIDGYGTFFWTRKSEDYKRVYFARTDRGMLTVKKVYRKAPEGSTEPQIPIAVIWASESYGLKKSIDLLGLEAVEIPTKPGETYIIEDGEVTNIARPFTVSPPRYSYVKGSNSNNSGVGYVGRQFGSGHGIYLDGIEGAEWDSTTGIWVPKSVTRPPWWRGDIGPHKETVDTQDVNGILQSLTYCMGNEQLSRKERKHLKARLKYFRSLNLSIVCDPDPIKVHNGVGIRRTPETTTDSTGNILHCPTCTCDLRNHLWGWCGNDTKQFCRSKMGQGCEPLGKGLKICNACGHYLVAGIHSVDDHYAMVSCDLCDQYCCTQTATDADTPTPTDDDEEPDTMDTMIARVEQLAHRDQTTAPLQITDGNMEGVGLD